MKKLLITLLVAISLFSGGDYAFADTELSDYIENLGEGADLYMPDESDLNRRAVNINGMNYVLNVIYQVIDVFKYGLGTATLVTMFILGIKMQITSSSEESVTEAKNHFLYALIGFVVIMISDYAVRNVFFGAQGEVFQTTETAQYFGRMGSLEVQRIYRGLQYFVGAVAVLSIIYNGFRMVTSVGEDIDANKKGVYYSIGALVFIGLAEIIVKEIIFDEQGTNLNIGSAIDLMIMITNFISALAGFATVALVMYAGVQYTLAAVVDGNEENGKKTLIAAVIGLIIMIGAYGLTYTMILFK